MPYFSTEPGGLGEFGCGAGCPCKSCRSAANVGEVYEKEQIAPPAPAKPAAPKMAGWFGEPPLPRPRVSVMPGQLQMPPFEVLTGYARGQWRLNQAQLARIQRLAEHIVRAWTTASPVTGVRLIGFAEPPEAQTGLQRAVGARRSRVHSTGSAPAFCAALTSPPRMAVRPPLPAAASGALRLFCGSDSCRRPIGGANSDR
jgi:hypothetical protein